jgi:hypothetical protein
MPNQTQNLISQASELLDMITIHDAFNDAQTQKAQSLKTFVGEGSRNGIQAP